MSRRVLAVVGVALAFSATACAASAPEAVTVPTAAKPVTTTVSTIAVTPVPCAVSEAVKSYRPTSSLPTPGAMPSGTFMRTIQDRGRLVVGTSADVLQFGARNPFTGKIEGFDVDMLHEVSRAIFGDPDKLQFTVINYAQRIPKLRDKSVDIVAHTMTINCTRWTQVAFSTEYYRAGQTLLVRDDSKVTSIKQMNGQRICVAKGSTNIEEIKKYPEVVAVPVDDLGTCLALFQQGSVAAIIGDDTVLAGFAVQDKYAKLLTSRLTVEPYGLAMGLDHRDFVEFVNALLERMRSDGTWARIYCKWLSCPSGNAPAAPVAVYGR